MVCLFVLRQSLTKEYEVLVDLELRDPKGMCTLPDSIFKASVWQSLHFPDKKKKTKQEASRYSSSFLPNANAYGGEWRNRGTLRKDSGSNTL